MNKRSFNDIEQQIKEMAEAAETAFDEAAWQRMELLLDKDKDRKKPFFWLWLLAPLMLGAVGFYLYSASTSKINSPIGSVATGNGMPSKQGSGIDQLKLRPVEENNFESVEVQPSDTAGMSASVFTKPFTRPVAEEAVSAETIHLAAEEVAMKPNRSKISEKTNAGTSAKIVAPAAEGSIDQSQSPLQVTMADSSVAALQDGLHTPVSEPPSTESAKPKVRGSSDTAVSKTSLSKLRKSERLYLLAAAGGEINSVKLFSQGEVTARFGLAVGYRLNKRFSLQTGFFAGSKKYVAGP